jgi:hypothetical protein
VARRRVEEPVDQGDGPPEKLRRFNLDDWADYSQPVPESWPHDGYPYHLFMAKRRWQTARREWAAEHGKRLFEAFPVASWLPERGKDRRP